MKYYGLTEWVFLVILIPESKPQFLFRYKPQKIVENVLVCGISYPIHTCEFSNDLVIIFEQLLYNLMEYFPIRSGQEGVISC